MHFDLEKWSHRATPIYMILIAATAPTAFLPDRWWARLINLPIILILLAAICIGQFHGKMFCEYCAANTPADGVEAARKKRRPLKAYHRLTASWTGVAYLGAVIIVPYVLPKVWPSFIAWAALMPGLLWMLWAVRVHDLLKPWCPWCRDEGWDDDLVEPSPDPHGREIPIT